MIQVSRAGQAWAVVLLGVLALTEVMLRSHSTAAFSLTLVLALAMTAPVALSRTQPALAAVLIMSAGVITVLSGGLPPVAGLLALLLTLFLTGRHTPVRGLVIPALCAVAAAAIAFSVRPSLPAVGIGVLALAAGVTVRARESAAARQAAEQVMSDNLLEHVARGERARIARELHDVVAHHISLIALKADAVRLATHGMPAEGTTGLLSIADTARTALSEMRRLLGVLREDTGGEPPRQPQPGLQQLNELLDTARATSGGSARLIVQGHVRPLDAGLELTAYRIVQEALTNARRHAPAASVDVDLTYGQNALTVRIRDNGPGRQPGHPGGHGLTGMRERAAMLGGSLEAGPASPGGFLVKAILPISGEQR